MILFLNGENAGGEQESSLGSVRCVIPTGYSLWDFWYVVECVDLLSEVWSLMEMQIWESLGYHGNWSYRHGRNYLVRCSLVREEYQRQTLGKLAFKRLMEEEGLWKKLRYNQGRKPVDKGRRKWFVLSRCITTGRQFKYFLFAYFILKMRDKSMQNLLGF